QTMGQNRVNFGAAPPHVAFASDGVHLVRTKDGKSVWIDPLTKAESEPIPEPAENVKKEEELVAALAKLSGFDEATAKRAAGGRRHASADGAAILLEHENELLFFRHGKDKALHLTTSAAEQADLAPDGRFASFVRENNLY